VDAVDRMIALQPLDYTRVGIHSSFGEIALGLWLEFFLVHEAHHLCHLAAAPGTTGANTSLIVRLTPRCIPKAYPCGNARSVDRTANSTHYKALVNGTESLDVDAELLFAV
jgi:hypothetical protein